jgi:galactokinase
MLEEKKAELGDLCYRRARHVIGENLRVAAFAEAVGKADWDTAGVAMRASHASLKDDFEVSCGEVDTLVSLADTIPSAAAVYGARMTGGGFGGCIVALVKSESVQQVAEEMIEAYRNALGIETDYLITRPGEGARVLYKA